MEINKVSTVNTTSNMVFPGINSDSSVKTEIAKSDKTETKVDEPKKEYKVNRKQLDSSVSKANSIFFKNNTHLQFKILSETHDVIVKIINDESGEVIKEIPPEKFVDMMAKICEVTGVIVDEKR